MAQEMVVESTGVGPSAQAERTPDTAGAHNAYGGLSEKDWLAKCVREFKAVMDDEAEDRTAAEEDDLFKLGGEHQWPEYARRNRQGSDGQQQRPMFTMNMLPQFCNQVHNRIRQQRAEPRVVADSDDANDHTAEIYQDLIRQIYNNGGEWARDWAASQAIDGGWGYMLVNTRYVDDETDAQELVVEPVFNRFSVYMDPNAKTPWGEDADYCFISWFVARESLPENAREWPEAGTGDREPWYLKDGDAQQVRVALKFWRELPEAVTITVKDEDGTERTITRPGKRRRVWRQKMVAHQALEAPVEIKMTCGYIPVVRVTANLQSIGGKARRYGLVRQTKDEQRVINLSWTDAIEDVALGVRAGAMGAAGAFENFEHHWDAAIGGKPQTRLEYNPVAEEATGQLAPPPTLLPQRDVPAGKMSLLTTASQGLREALGIYDTSLGKESNERSGVAIWRRQEQGNQAQFHIEDNLAYAERHLARILVDMIPFTYDTRRMQRVRAEDGTERRVQLDPELMDDEGNPLAYRDQSDVDEATGRTKRYQKTYNLGAGRYDVRIVTGRSFATRKEEAAEGIAAILGPLGPEQAFVLLPELVENLDWPGAEKIARILRLLREQQYPFLRDAKEGEEEDPLVRAQQAEARLAQVTQLAQEMAAEIEKLEFDLANKQLDAQAKVQVAYLRLIAELAESESSMDVEALRARVALTLEQLRQFGKVTVPERTDFDGIRQGGGTVSP